MFSITKHITPSPLNPSAPLVALNNDVWDPFQSISIESEIVGAGTGSEDEFATTLAHLFIKHYTPKFHYTIDDVVYTASDNWKGVITGPYCSGTIDYQTGEVALVFTTPPDNSTNVEVDYAYNAYGYDRPFACIGKLGDITVNLL